MSGPSSTGTTPQPSAPPELPKRDLTARQTNYSRGHAIEAKVIEELRAEGFSTTRAAGSKGFFDVIAYGTTKAVFASVKRSGTWQGAAKVYRRERRRMERAPLPASPAIERRLYVWADHGAPGATGQGGRWYCHEVVEPAN